MGFSMFTPKPESSRHQAKYCWNTKQQAVPAAKSFPCKRALDNQYLCKLRYAHTCVLQSTFCYEGLMQIDDITVRPMFLKAGPYVWKCCMSGVLLNCSGYKAGCYPKDMRWGFSNISSSALHWGQCLLTVFSSSVKEEIYVKQTAKQNPEKVMGQ